MIRLAKWDRSRRLGRGASEETQRTNCYKLIRCLDRYLTSYTTRGVTLDQERRDERDRYISAQYGVIQSQLSDYMAGGGD